MIQIGSRCPPLVWTFAQAPVRDRDCRPAIAFPETRETPLCGAFAGCWSRCRIRARPVLFTCAGSGVEAGRVPTGRARGQSMATFRIAALRSAPSCMPERPVASGLPLGIAALAGASGNITRPARSAAGPMPRPGLRTRFQKAAGKAVLEFQGLLG